MKNIIEEHDPFCPRSDLDAAWNGADCACVVIRLVRSIEDVEVTTPGDYLLERIDREINGPMGVHDPLCPPGIKSVTPERCTWCVTIEQARREGPLP